MGVGDQAGDGGRRGRWRLRWRPGRGGGGAEAETPSGLDIGYDYPRWEYPEYPAGSVVEIRVHGVGGEPPSRMARDPHPVLVGGDAVAGFWRARDPVVDPLAAGGPDGSSASNGHRSTAQPDEPAHVREVLSWGGQTRGTWRHALWVLLLPFSLVNLAGRMQPYTVHGRQARTYRRVARVVAYTLTLTVTALAAGVAFDLLGAQCAQASSCLEGGARPDGPRLLEPLRGLDGHPAAQMGLLALLPVAVVLVLWLAGKYRTRELEGYEPEDTPPADPQGEQVRLDQPDFWHNEWPTSRLRAAHASGAFAYVGLVLSLVMMDLTGDEWWWAGVAVSAFGVAGCGAVVAAAVTLAPRPIPALSRALTLLRLAALTPLTTGATVGLLTAVDLSVPRWAAIALASAGVAAILGWAAIELGRKGTAAGAGSPGQEGARVRPDVGLSRNLILVGGLAGATAGATWFLGALDASAPTIRDWTVDAGALTWIERLPGDLLPLFAGLYLPAYVLLPILLGLQVVLVALLAALAVPWTPAASRAAARADAGPLRGPGVWGNLGGAVCVLLALLLVAAVGAGAHAAVLELLGSRASADEVARLAAPAASASPVRLVLPWWYADTAVSVFFMALIGLVMGAGVVLRTRRGIATTDVVARDLDRGWVDPEPGRVDTDPRVQERLRDIALQWNTVHRVRLAGRAAFLTLLGGTLAAAVVVITRAGDAPLASGLPALTADPRFAGFALGITTAGAVALVEVLRRSMKNPGDSGVAGLWDVVNFWPRVTHPFAPPCYGEAVVPMLRARIEGLLDRAGGGYRVLLAGHSQGSVVSLAAVLSLRADPQRVALISYGSPVAVLYERHFRGIVGTDHGAIRKACGTVSSWHHFFALTEPFAAPFWWVRDETGRTQGTLDDAQQGCGWKVNVAYPHAEAACPTCGWSRSDPLPGPGWEPRCATVDVVVTDPQRWRMPLDTVPPTIAGHGTYHDSLEMDDHIHAIARRLASTQVRRLPVARRAIGSVRR